MYRQEYNQNYGQPESYGQYHGQYGGYNTDPAVPSSCAAQPRIVLDDYNSDLNFVIGPDGVTGLSLHKDGFEYMWAGARATHGIRTGKVRYNVGLDVGASPTNRWNRSMIAEILVRSLA